MDWLWLAVLLVVLVGGYSWYAAIVTRRNRVSEAFAGIDVQLQQRHDLIPNLLTIAKRFMDHERGLMEEIAALRTQASGQVGDRDFARIGERLATEAKLDQRVGSLMALAENYPQLRSDGPMIEAQRAYSEVEANISAARRFYNSAVGDLRNATQIFPGSLLKGLAGVGELPPFFEATSPAIREPVAASSVLGT